MHGEHISVYVKQKQIVIHSTAGLIALRTCPDKGGYFHVRMTNLIITIGNAGTIPGDPNATGSIITTIGIRFRQGETHGVQSFNQ
jgi:hypothetical protein